MIRRVLTSIVGRLLSVAILLTAMEVYTQNTSGRHVSSQDFISTLISLSRALMVLSHSFR
jgi:hypothetical protein